MPLATEYLVRHELGKLFRGDCRGPAASIALRRFFDVPAVPFP